VTWDRRSEQGNTMLELIMAIAIIGLTASALLGGLASGMISSGLHRQQTDVGAVLAAAGESVKDPAVGRNPFVVGAGTATYSPTAGVTLPSAAWSAANVVITAVQYWNGTAFQSTSADASSGGVLKMQLITITVTSPNGQSAQTRSFVKSVP
jgi:prepilin-type N-terminal cleavage/methylation domain-containing protein